MSIFRQADQENEDEQNKRFVKRNPKRKTPCDPVGDAPTCRQFISQTPLGADADRDEHDEQRLMVRPTQLGSVNEDRTDSVEQQHDPAVTKFHSTRPPPKEPAGEQREKWRDNCASQIDWVRCEWLQQDRQ